MRPGEASCGDHFLHFHAGVSQRNVLAHRAVEEDVLLQDDADLPPHPGRVGDVQVHAVHQHAARLRHIEALHQPCEGALAGAGGPYDPQNLPRRNLQRDLLHHQGAVGAVAEGDVVRPRMSPRMGGRWHGPRRQAQASC